MSEAMNFMNNIMGQVTDGINNCMLAKIDFFDPTTMRAEAKPLLKKQYKDGTIEGQELLIEVPVSFLKAGPFFIRPPYKEGDIVLVVFADGDIENVLLSGEESDPNSTRKHSLDDAIIVGGIMPYTMELPEEHAEDLVIANEDMSQKIVLHEDGNITIKTDGEMNMEGDVVNIKGDSIINMKAPTINLN